MMTGGIVMNRLCECGCGGEVISKNKKPGNNKKARFIIGHGFKGEKHSIETRARMSKSRIGRKLSIEHREKLLKANLGRKLSIEIRAKMSKSHMGKTLSAEHKEKLLSSRRGKKHTDETKAKISKSRLSDEYKEKTRQTCIEKYGVENAMQSDVVREKHRQSCVKHYGVENPNQSEEVREDAKKTCLDKYGVEFYVQAKECREKSRQTCLEHYGVESWRKTSQGRTAARIQCIERIEKQRLNGEPLIPCIGIQERSCLDELQKYVDFTIIRNDASFRYIKGRYPDGHIKELKLFIQFDENWHNVAKIKEDDIRCTKDLESISGYKVFRVSEKEWKENKEMVIGQFRSLL